jgi:hypothetical protein
LLSPKTPERREKKKVLDDGGFAFGRVLAISTRCFVAFFFFLAFCGKKGLLPHQIANILEKKGEGKYHSCSVLSFDFLFCFFLSLIFLHTQSSRELQIKHKKQMCFFQLSNKKDFSQKGFSVSCVTVIMMVMCSGCLVPDVA